MPPISTGVTTEGAAHFTAGTALAAAAPPIGGVAYVVYRTVEGYHKLINSTDAVLDLAIKEVLEWQCSTTNKDNSAEAVSKEKKLEFPGKYENLTQS